MGCSQGWWGSEQRCGLPESFAARSRFLTEPLQYVVTVYIKITNLSKYLLLYRAEERVPCIQKWKAAPKQLPISNEAESEMQLMWQGRSQQLGAGSGAAPGAAGAEPGPAGAVGAPPARLCGVLGSRVGW